MEENLLYITLSKLGDVPKVFYKGEEITKKLKVSFHWETKTDEYGGCQIHLEHFEENNSVRTIKHKTDKFVLGSD